VPQPWQPQLHSFRSAEQAQRELRLSKEAAQLLPGMADEVLAALLRVVQRGYAPGQHLLPLQLAPEALEVLFQDWWQHCWADVQLVLRFAEQQGSKGGWLRWGQPPAYSMCADLALPKQRHLWQASCPSPAPQLQHALPACCCPAGDALQAEPLLLGPPLRPWLQRSRQLRPLQEVEEEADKSSYYLEAEDSEEEAGAVGAAAEEHTDAQAGPGKEAGDCALCRLPGAQLEQLVPLLLQHSASQEALLQDGGAQRLVRAVRLLPQQQRLELAWQHLQLVLQQLPSPSQAPQPGQQAGLQEQDLEQLLHRCGHARCAGWALLGVMQQ
jgi:hypothetical protein